MFEHGIVNRVTSGSIFAYQGWPSVTRDEKGTLYAVSSSFRTQHICPFGKTVMYKSFNNGKTWTPPIVINDTPLDDRDVGILYLGNGKMLITWFSHPTEVYLHQYYTAIKNTATLTEAPATLGMLAGYPLIPSDKAKGGSFIRISDDYGVTWSDTVQVPISAPHGPGLLSDGTIIYVGKEMYSSDLPTPEESKVIVVYASVDGGCTWTKRGICQKPENLSWDNFHEPHIVELSDGRLLVAIRAQGANIPHGFSVYTTTSSDGGKTFDEWRCLNISGSPPCLLRHSSGAIICVYGRREPPYGERAIVSYDNGETWSDEYILDERANSGDLGYPSTVELDDGSLLTVYYQRYYDDKNDRYDEKCSILYTHWHL